MRFLQKVSANIVTFEGKATDDGALIQHLSFRTVMLYLPVSNACPQVVPDLQFSAILRNVDGISSNVGGGDFNASVVLDCTKISIRLFSDGRRWDGMQRKSYIVALPHQEQPIQLHDLPLR